MKEKETDNNKCANNGLVKKPKCVGRKHLKARGRDENNVNGP
jgi:hypothetical protein